MWKKQACFSTVWKKVFHAVENLPRAPAGPARRGARSCLFSLLDPQGGRAQSLRNRPEHAPEQFLRTHRDATEQLDTVPPCGLNTRSAERHSSNSTVDKPRHFHNCHIPVQCGSQQPAPRGARTDLLTSRSLAKIIWIHRASLQIHVDDTAFPLIYSNMRARLCACAISALAPPLTGARPGFD